MEEETKAWIAVQLELMHLRVKVFFYLDYLPKIRYSLV